MRYKNLSKFLALIALIFFNVFESHAFIGFRAMSMLGHRNLSSVPSAPGGVSASNNPLQATISWSAVSGATSYNVYFSNNSGLTKTTYNGTNAYPGTPSSIAGKYTGLTGTSYSVNGPLSEGTIYYLVVSAVNASGESVLSSTVSAVAAAGVSAPAAPTIGNAAGFGLTVSWNAVAGATSYTVARSLSSNMAAATSLGVKTSGFTDTGLNPSTVYYYTVTSVSGGVSSAASTPGSGTTNATDCRYIPMSYISYDWDCNDSATYWNSMSVGLTSPYYRGAVADTGYDYCEYTEYDEYWVDYYICKEIIPVPASPAAPVISVPTASTLTVSWAAVSHASSYTVKRSLNADMSAATNLGAKVSGFIDSSLNSNTTYYYTVTAVNVTGSSAASPVGSLSTSGGPSTPTNSPTFSNPTLTSIVVSWNPVAGATSYNVARSTSADMTGAVQLGAKTSGFTDTGLNANTYYYYTYSAVDANGSSASSPIGLALTSGTYSITVYATGTDGAVWRNAGLNAAVNPSNGSGINDVAGQGMAGYIFRNISIPKGATINSAVLRNYYGYTGFKTPNTGYAVPRPMDVFSINSVTNVPTFVAGETLAARKATGAIIQTYSEPWGHYHWADHDVKTQLQASVNLATWSDDANNRSIGFLYFINDNYPANNGGTYFGFSGGGTGPSLTINFSY